MNVTRKFPIVILQILLLVVLALGLAWAIRAFRGPGGATQVYPPPEPSASSVTRQNPSPYPPPEQAATTTPLPETSAISDGSTQNQGPYPMPMIAPTFTPLPSPTLRPGATNTPIPPIQPAKDASGSLLYLALEENGAVALEALQVDASGAAKGKPEQISKNIFKGIIFPSPDYSQLAIIANGGFEIFSLDKREIIPTANLNFEQFFNWFPDNRQVLIRANLGSLWLADPVSGEHTPLAVPGLGAIDGSAASPDGSKVIYAYRQNNLSPTTGIWLVDSTGRDTKPLTEATGDLYGFAWSPDGTKIAFFGDGLTVMDADGSNIRKVDINAGAICNLMPPLWSPDSKKLAVIWSKTDAFCDSGVEAKGYSGTEIVLVDVESGKGYSLTPDQGRGYLDPAWSPDGTWLAFISAQIGEYQLWVANANGSNQHQLLKDQRPIRFPVWCKS
jgi:hypothetical protein